MAFKDRSLIMELLMLTLPCILLKSNAFSMNSDRDAIKYLQQFGYLEDSEYYRSGDGSVKDDTVVNAIKDFQSFSGLNPTGVLDKNTMNKMNSSRCGVKDRNPLHTRRKRFAIQGSRWILKNLTYCISKYPSRLKDPEVVDREIARAFKVWSDVTMLRFEDRRDILRVNIDIRFESRYHGDRNPFDGPGSVLAHATYPQFGGDVHFDDEEEWTIDEAAGINLFQAAVHEFGHALGLDHSRVNESIMFPFYRDYDPDFKLHEDDIAGICELYVEARTPLYPSSSFSGQPDEPTTAENAPDIQNDWAGRPRSRWIKRHLTYGISKYPSRLKDTEAVDREFARAFKVWSDVADLSFEERRYRPVNIDIRFVERAHGDGFPFDGPGNLLAHTMYPEYGSDIHFDDEEEWTIDKAAGNKTNSDGSFGLKKGGDREFERQQPLPNMKKSLFQVAVHEIGHALGLEHSRVMASAMSAYNKDYDPNFKLHEIDIAVIQELYGKPRKLLSPSSGFNGQPDERTAAENAPDICQDAVIDTILYVKNYGTYAFKGDYCWKIEDKHIAKGYPRRIFSEWDGLEGNLDASLTWSNGKIFFFKGDKYWRFSNKTMDAAYPRLISIGFEGIPDNIDAALLWTIDGGSYFFKGDQFWQYDYKTDPPVGDRYPRPISYWKGIPNNLSAIFLWDDDSNYFFKGDQYYRFNDAVFEVAFAKPPYPRPTARWWFSC